MSVRLIHRFTTNRAPPLLEKRTAALGTHRLLTPATSQERALAGQGSYRNVRFREFCWPGGVFATLVSAAGRPLMRNVRWAPRVHPETESGPTTARMYSVV